MKIKIVAIGNKMPSWIEQGFQEYQKRFFRDFKVELIEIPACKRVKLQNIKKIKEEESMALLRASENYHCIILDVLGRSWNTTQLSIEFEKWKNNGKDIAFLIGGPEGLSDECKQVAEQSWSLSNLTLPHPLVRVVVIESLYRALSIINHLPYHRE